jgi:hypothetical protein
VSPDYAKATWVLATPFELRPDDGRTLQAAGIEWVHRGAGFQRWLAEHESATWLTTGPEVPLELTVLEL